MSLTQRISDISNLQYLKSCWVESMTSFLQIVQSNCVSILLVQGVVPAVFNELIETLNIAVVPVNLIEHEIILTIFSMSQRN